jgi:hypothetical protein
MDNSQLINQTSLNTEYYTPVRIVELARLLMGGISYDPASSKHANEYIDALAYSVAPSSTMIYEGFDDLPTAVSIGNGGLDRQWFGKVWMNHPFGSRERACRVPNCKKESCKKRGYHIASDLLGNEDWVNKIVSSYENHDIEEGVMICYASTSEKWFRPLLDYPKCWIHGRVNYLDPATMKEVKGSTKGSVITYFGTNIQGFSEVFSAIGSCHNLI